MGLDVLSSVYIRDVLAGNEQFYGLMVGMIGVGTFAITLVLMFRRGAANPWKELVIGIFMLAGIPAVMVISDVWIDNNTVARGLVLAGSLLGGVGNGFVGGPNEHPPPDAFSPRSFGAVWLDCLKPRLWPVS